MKKQINLPFNGRKLNLNKKTISNLTTTEMSNKIGGLRTYFYCHTGGAWCGNYSKGCSKNNNC